MTIEKNIKFIIFGFLASQSLQRLRGQEPKNSNINTVVNQNTLNLLFQGLLDFDCFAKKIHFKVHFDFLTNIDIANQETVFLYLLSDWLNLKKQ